MNETDHVCDAHIHFFSHRFFALLGEQKGGLSAEQVARFLDWPAPPEDPVELAKQWVAEMDEHGVKRAALIASLPGDEGSVEAAVRAYPTRFYGYFFANPSNSAGIDRVAAALEGGRMRVVCLFPAMHAYSLHDPALRPFWDLGSRTPGVAVFVHCGVLSVGIRRRLGLPSPFDIRFSNPVDLHAIALRYGGTPFVIPHFGAGYFREALMVASLCPNVYLDTSSSNEWMKFQPESLALSDVFRRALDVTGPERLLFGTDSSFFPRGWNEPIFREQVAALTNLGLPESDVQAILGGNLERLLR